MVKYMCKLCEFTSARKTDYTRHIASNKHLQKVDALTIESKSNLPRWSWSKFPSLPPVPAVFVGAGLGSRWTRRNGKCDTATRIRRCWDQVIPPFGPK